MLIKFLNHGTGSGVKAAKYLLGRSDANGEMRKDVIVLRGDPLLVGHLADSLKFRNKYTSGVFAWHPDDDPTEGDMAQVLDDIEALAFAGLVPSQYAIAAVLHVGQDNSKHIHWITPRVELSSGRTFNAAPPGHLRAFDALRDKWNYSRGWARPDDPDRRRLLQPGPSWRAHKPKPEGSASYGSLSADDGALEAALTLEPDTRKVLEGLAIELVFGEEVNTRQELVDRFKCFAEVTRAGADYISVKIKGADRAIRLKGEIFNVNADYSAIRAASVDSAVDQKPLRAYARKPKEAIDGVKAADAKARLDTEIAARLAYNRKRYPLLTLVPSPVPNHHEPDGQEDVPEDRSSIQDAMEESLLLYGRTPYLAALDELVDLVPETIDERYSKKEALDHAHNERTGNTAFQDLKATAGRTYTADSSIDRASNAIGKCIDSVVRTCRRILDFTQRQQRSLTSSGTTSQNHKQ